MFTGRKAFAQGRTHSVEVKATDCGIGIVVRRATRRKLAGRVEGFDGSVCGQVQT